jgi:hypothetical protein
MARVLRAGGRPVFDSCSLDSRSALVLTDLQQDFLAGYLYGALERLRQVMDSDPESDLAHAAYQLHGRLFGGEAIDFDSWRQWVITDGLYHFRRPHVFLGYCTGRNDVISKVCFGGSHSPLADSLRHLESVGEPIFGAG